MRRLLIITLSFLFTTLSCTQFDDSAILEKLQEQEERIARLENTCKRINAEILAQQRIVTALQECDYVTGITDLFEDGEIIGYTICFHKNEPVNIYFGKDGSNGNDGENGEDGKDGKNGHTPSIGMCQDYDLKYYWTLDGEWLTDEGGNKIPVNGESGMDGAPGNDGLDGVSGENGQDGKDGTDGSDGKDGVTPEVKVQDGYWYISYDNGANWDKLYKADGVNGNDGDSFISGLDFSSDDYIILTLTDGQQITLPKWEAFLDLQNSVNRLNTNISTLQKLIQAAQENDYITDIRTLTENGTEVGYTIIFAKNSPVTIYHGKDGKNGQDGQNGEDGQDGAPGQDGEDGHNGEDGRDGEDGEDGKDGVDGRAPKIGIQKDENGTYYWTIDGEWMQNVPDIQFPSGGDSYWVIDGEWLLDEEGNRLPVVGKNGKDGVTPVLKIENGYWYVSFDGGRTFSSDTLGPAKGQPESDIFSDVSFDENYLYLTLQDGQMIILSLDPSRPAFTYSVCMNKITHHSVRILGNIGVPESDLQFSRVTMYYSEDDEFNIYTAQSATIQDFDYNGNFSLYLNDLKENSTYTYCFNFEAKGVVLIGDISRFKTKERVASVLDLSMYTPESGLISVSGGYTVWSTASAYQSYQIPLSDMGYPEWITITANANYGAYVALLREKATSAYNSLTPPYAAGWNTRIVIASLQSETFEVPLNAEYLYIYFTNSNGDDYTPELVEYDTSQL